ncbi:adenylate kinase [Halanaerobiaceae bacterium Z-7014]|uniref:Adenylate kinase n=1 Tax=Halonatronomonas betaini TaxID=2778430 RepID=A0A931AT84_9FIRM|nr:adenylate kinase [Halonatronomonas betaini]MBF8438032.1 adenylate kinase [Halonatronomonas betaini]
MNLVFLGLPGAGKGTQAKILANKYDIPHISTGDIFRNAIKNETPLGVKAKEYIDSGELVPDEVTNGIVKERLQDKDCNKGFILDGYPRTLDQVEALDSNLDDFNKKIDLVIYTKVSESELIKRLTGRRICEDCGATYHVDFKPPKEESICDECGGKLIQRDDDKEETVKKRINVNKNKTEKLIKYYDEKNILIEIDAEKDIDEVTNDIVDVIEEKIR